MQNAMKNYRIAIAGATGAVGAELLKVLERRNFPVTAIDALASGKSVGKTVSFRNQAIPVQELREDSFAKIDIAFFSAGGERSRKFVPIARDAGARSSRRQDAHNNNATEKRTATARM